MQRPLNLALVPFLWYDLFVVNNAFSDSYGYEKIATEMCDHALGLGVRECPVDWSARSQYSPVNYIFKRLEILPPADLPEVTDRLKEMFTPQSATAENDQPSAPTAKSVVFKFLGQLTDPDLGYCDPAIADLRESYFEAKKQNPGE